MAPSPAASAPFPVVATVTSSMASRRVGANWKKLVPPLLKRWELLFMPSREIFIEALGSPLNVPVRPLSLLPMDWLPAIKVAKGSVSRPLSGRS